MLEKLLADPLDLNYGVIDRWNFIKGTGKEGEVIILGCTIKVFLKRRHHTSDESIQANRVRLRLADLTKYFVPSCLGGYLDTKTQRQEEKPIFLYHQISDSDCNQGNPSIR